MPEIYADWVGMESVANSIESNISQLENLLRQASDLKRGMSIIGRESDQIMAAIDKCNNNNVKVINRLESCKTVLTQSAQLYQRTEHPFFVNRRISDIFLKNLTNSNRRNANAQTATSTTQNNDSDTHDFWNHSGTLDQTGYNVNTVIWGAPAALTVLGQFLTGSTKSQGKAKFDLKKGNVEAFVGVEAEGSVLRGKLDENIGMLSANGQVDLLTGTATGKIGASLFKNGKFMPSVYAKGKVGADVLKGKVGTKFGNEKHDAHVNAEGSLLGANAEGTAQIGMIEYTDSNGNKNTGLGGEVSVGAEAYVAKGRVSGGIKVFGVQIDLGVAGKALDVGGTAGVKYIPGKFKGKIGAGLGLGAELDISIDWSKAAFPDLSFLKFW